jgi:general secretion pathway protein G
LTRGSPDGPDDNSKGGRDMNDRCKTQRRAARPGRSGFTLVELLLVMVIITVLAGIIVPKFVHRSEQARVTAARADIANLGVALDSYEIDTGKYPTTERGLDALVVEPTDTRDWHGPYIKQGTPKDPWGNPYVYKCPGDHNASGYDLSSFGPDGRSGGDDIDNWSSQ